MTPTTTNRTSTADAGLSIVVPVYNEGRGLNGFHARLEDVARQLRQKRGLATEVVYVDDGSRDDSYAVAQTLPAEALDVQVISLSRNFGKEAALLAGLDHSKLRAVLVIDGGGPHPPAPIPTLVGPRLHRGHHAGVTPQAPPPQETP